MASEAHAQELLSRARDLRAMGDAASALSVLDHMLPQAGSDLPVVQLGRGEILLDLGRTGEAGAAFQAALAEAQDLPADRWPALISGLAATGDLPGVADRLRARLDATTEAAADDAQLYVARGTLLAHLGQIENACNEFDYAAELDPDLLEAWLGVAECALATGDLLDAADALDRAADLDPNDIGLFARMGDALLEGGEAARAVHAFEEGLELASDEPSLLAGRARASLALEPPVPSDALEDCERCLELAPADARVWVLKGRALYAMGRDDEAVRAYGRALELDPGALDALRYRGDAALDAGRHADAERDYRAVLAEDPSDADTWLGLAEARFAQGDTDGATSAASEALDRDPGLSEARLIAARGLVRAGDSAGAIRALDAALEQDPEADVVYRERAQALWAAGLTNLAWRDARWAIDLNPDDPEGYILRARIALEIESPKEALDDLDDALEIDPEDPVALAWHGRALQLSGDIDRATSDWSEAEALLPARDPLRHLIATWRNELS